MQTGADGRAGRGDFSGASGATGSSAALEVVYPDAGAKVHVPTDLGHQPTVVDSAGQRAVRRFEVLGTP
jgi:hypothetical protein